MSTISPSPKPSFSNYSEFWRHYVSQHQQPLNQFLHVVGTLIGVICVGLAAAVSWKWLLLVVPAGYGVAWIGHFQFERNRPLSWTYPLWSLIADFQMMVMLFTRRPLSSENEIVKDEPQSRRAA